MDLPGLAMTIGLTLSGRRQARYTNEYTVEANTAMHVQGEGEGEGKCTEACVDGDLRK